MTPLYDKQWGWCHQHHADYTHAQTGLCPRSHSERQDWLQTGGYSSELWPSGQKPRASCSVVATWSMPLQGTHLLLNLSFPLKASCLPSLPLALPDITPQWQPEPKPNPAPAKPQLNGGWSWNETQLPSTGAPSRAQPASHHFLIPGSSSYRSHTYLVSRC